MPEKVAPDTRRRVEEAIQALDFVPSRAARGLITGRTGNIAVIVPDITNPHFAAIVRSVERSARQSDLQVLLVDTGEHPDEEARAAASLSRDVDAFIVVAPRRLHRSLDVLGDTPAVFVNRPVPEHASVLLRTASAVGDAFAHLSGLGHSRLAYLGGPSGSWAAGERRSAVRRSGPPNGMEVLELVVDEPTFEAAVGTVREIVASGVSAVLAFNDQMALGVVAGLSELGVRVPRDISVIGVDDVPMAAMVAPPLTTIGLPTEEVGAAAMAMLDGGPSKKELFGDLILRHSTATARAR